MPAVLASCRNCGLSHMLSWVPTEEIEFTVFTKVHNFSFPAHLFVVSFFCLEIQRLTLREWEPMKSTPELIEEFF